MNNTPQLTTLQWMALFIIVTSNVAFAQKSTSTVVESDQPVKLDTFVVHTDNAEGSYLASESTTGTRAVAKISELPFPVQVVTSEFIRDFNLTEIDDMLAYTSGSTPGNTQGGGDIGKYTRGFTADFQLRNGFNRVGLNDRSNIDRIEVIKGPYAAIYGRSTPGGIINVITKQPAEVPTQTIGLSFGTLDRSRVEISSTGKVPLLKIPGKFLYRIDAAWDKNDGGQRYVYNESKPVSGVLLWIPTDRTRITFEAEYIDRLNNEGNVVPFLRPQGLAGTAFNDAVTSFAPGLLYFSTQGPKYLTHRTNKGATLTLEHRLNDVVVIRANANSSRRNTNRFSFGGGAWLNIDPVSGAQNIGSNAGVADRATNNNINLFDTDSAQIDILSRWRTGKVAHQLLVTGDYFKNDDLRRVNTLPNTAISSTNPYGNLNADNAYNLRSLDPRNPIFLERGLDDLKPYLIRRTQDLLNTTRVVGAFGSYRATALDNRLIASIGVRYDRATGTYRDWALTEPRPAEPRVFVFKPAATTHNEGINFQVIREKLTLFISHSTSFNTQSPRDASSNQTALDNERGNGYEGGLKGELLDRKLNFTLTTYDIDRRNVRLANPDVATDPSAPAFILSGKQKAKGVEFDGQYSPGADLTFFGGVGYTDIRTLEAKGSAVTEVNRQVAKVPRVGGGAGMRYKFNHAALKGMSFTLGARYLGETRSNNLYFNALTPSYTVWETGLSYSFRQGRFRQRLQGNIRNVFDKDYITTAAVPGTPQEFIGSYSISF